MLFSRRFVLGAAALWASRLSAQDAAAAIDAAAINEALPEMKPESRGFLRHIVTSGEFDGSLRATEVADLLWAESVDVGKLMVKLLPLAKLFSYPPISDFRVGAVARGIDGALYFGANLELGGLPLSQAVHAMQSAVASLYMLGDRGVASIAVTAPPCGHCRQFLYEFADGREIGVLTADGESMTLGELLPNPFGPLDLGLAGNPFKLGEHLLVATGEEDELGEAALRAAQHSYAPYSKSPSGVALRAGGKIYSGAYLENAAFNPALPPLQVALTALRMGRHELADIDAAVLAEVADAPIKQSGVTASVLSSIKQGVPYRTALY